MGIPENSLSSELVLDEYIPPDSIDRTLLTDYELGGIALYDTSEGLKYQNWFLSYDGSSLLVKPDNAQAIELFSMEGITECSLAFDQNMNPFIAYCQSGVPWIWWYDSEEATQVHTQLPEGASSPRVALDDKRQMEIGNSDVILAYMIDDSLYTRKQRDRFGVDSGIMVRPSQYEYLMISGIPEERIFYRMGMGYGNRLMFSHIENWIGSADYLAGGLLGVMETAQETGWVDLDLFPTITFETLFGQSVDDPDFTQAVFIGAGVKFVIKPVATAGPIEMSIVDSLDANIVRMSMAHTSGRIGGSLYYQGWEISGALQWYSHYDQWCIISSDTGMVRLRKQDKTPKVPT